MGARRNGDDRPLADRRERDPDPRDRRGADEGAGSGQAGSGQAGPREEASGRGTPGSESDERDPVELLDEPDFAEEHTPSATDPPNAEPDDNAPDERWERPTEV